MANSAGKVCGTWCTVVWCGGVPGGRWVTGSSGAWWGVYVKVGKLWQKVCSGEFWNARDHKAFRTLEKVRQNLERAPPGGLVRCRQTKGAHLEERLW